MAEVIFDLHISASEYLTWYQGSAQTVFVRAHNGLSVRFPANVLRPFVGHDGIHGSFVMKFDVDNKFKGIVRLDTF